MNMWKQPIFNIDRSKILEGDIVSSIPTTLLGFGSRFIADILNSIYSHDAIIVRHHRIKCVGNSHLGYFGARISPLDKLLLKEAKRKVRIRIARPSESCYDPFLGKLAAIYWIDNIHKKLYDIAVIPTTVYLYLRRITTKKKNWPEVRKKIKSKTPHFKSLYQCSEGTNKAWKNGSHIIICDYSHPSPKDFDIAVEKGVLKVIYESSK